MNFVVACYTIELRVGFTFCWLCYNDGVRTFVQEPEPPALIEKKDPVVRVIDQNC